MKTNEILKELRQQKNLTQQELAITLDINLSSYQKYERPNNTIKPSLDTLIKLADYYNVSVDYLLGRGEAKNPLLDIPTKPVNDDDFIAMYESLPIFVKEIFIEAMARLSRAAQTNKSKTAPIERTEKNYSIPTAARTEYNGYFSGNAENMPESEIQQLLNAEDADEDL